SSESLDRWVCGGVRRQSCSMSSSRIGCPRGRGSYRPERTGKARRRGEAGSVAAVVVETLAARLDLGFGVDAADPGCALDGLAGLEVLVDLEEVLDLQAVELGDVTDVA